MTHKRLITSVICSLVGLNALVTAQQPAPGRPKLVVGIVVDQLRTDYIEYLQSYFGKKGFNRLMKEGLYMRDLDFKVAMLDVANATALAYTGNYPYLNGVVSSQVYNPQTKTLQPALTDPEIIGNFTNATYSPANLLLSTISDEIAIDGGGLGVVYSLAPDAQQSIIMAGHGGTSAFWIDENTGKWATTTYYKEVPPAISNRNYRQNLSSRLDTMAWRPAMAIERYPGVPAEKRAYPFRHTFPKNDRDVYRMFCASPLANQEVTDMAVEYLKTLRLGTRGDVIDMLNVGYTVAPYKYLKGSDYRLELEDAYIRLDSQLGRLFDAIEQGPGLNNTLIFLTSTGYYNDAATEDEKYRIPSGKLSLKRASSLLNAYLSAKYGNGNYVDSFAGQHVYLNHRLIEEKHLDLPEIIKESREFLCKLSGVAYAYTLSDILSISTPEMEAYRLGIDPKKSGDLFVQVMPGWTMVDDIDYRQPDTNIRLSGVNTPAFIMYPTVAPQTISTPVDATAIAPTVTSILRIRAPNGASARPLLPANLTNN